jgi:hypothetical protein
MATEPTPPNPMLTMLRNFLWVIGVIVAGLAGVIVLGLGLTALGTPPPPAPQPIVNHRNDILAGIATYETTNGFRICSRADLHRCDIRFGWENSGDRGTFRFIRTNIRAAVSCDTQARVVASICTDAGAGNDFSEGARDRFARCAMPFGIILRGESTMSQVDPRDPQERPGALRVQCDEGFSASSFEDHM